MEEVRSESNQTSGWYVQHAYLNLNNPVGLSKRDPLIPVKLDGRLSTVSIATYGPNVILTGGGNYAKRSA